MLERGQIFGVALLLALPAMAHHSYSMFDMAKPIKLTGTVREFEWSNPHCFLQLLVAGPDKTQQQPDEWSIEMNSPGALVRAGWKPVTIKSGDRITVVVFPLRDGGKGGSFISAIGPNGKISGTQK